MSIKHHAVQAAIFSALFAPYLGWDTIVIFLSMLFIDLDHYLDYIIVCRRFGIKSMFKFHDWLWERRESIYAISIFHTVEVFLLLFVLGFFKRGFWLILFGFLIHYLADLYFLYKNNSLSVRAFSIIEYMLKRNGKGYPLPEMIFGETKK
ncbi:MAG: hypothetical protein HZA78_01590 [Candidatus Schekmanbacteria bacterium]|nr:hypothetical protein [Candidatus Schekmanbacteria bacterium]